LVVCLGLAGLFILLVPKAVSDAGGSFQVLLGCLAIVLGYVVSAIGSVRARSLLQNYPPLLISGHTLFAGGMMSVTGSLMFEPGARHALSLDWGAAAWASWSFLVLGGSIAAFTIYLRLVRDWGPSQAGSYCFVSPVIAMAIGVFGMGEQVSTLDLLGTATMLSAAWLAIRPAMQCEIPSTVVTSPRRSADFADR
jgi:drug/metabolite transporter (DMT)-like permease